MQEQWEKASTKWLEKGKKKAEVSLQELGAWEFACEPDIRIAIGELLQKNPLFCFTLMVFRRPFGRQ